MELIKSIRHAGKSALYLAPALALAGCSTFPTAFGIGQVYDPATGGYKSVYKTDITIDIVKKVRCELRDALIRRASDLIASRPEYLEYPGTREIVDKLRADPGTAKTLDAWEIDPRPQIRAGVVLNSAVKLDFSFDISETKNSSFQPTFTDGVKHHANTRQKRFNPNVNQSKANLTRKAKRTFSIDDTTIRRYQSMDCNYDHNKYLVRKTSLKDPVYPMRGNINLDKSIKNFIEFADLDTTLSERTAWAHIAAGEAIKATTGGYWTKPEDLIQLSKEVKDCTETKKNPDECAALRVCHKKTIAVAQDIFSSKYHGEHGKNSKSGVSVTDQLTFTTDLLTGISPSITFTAVDTFLTLSKFAASLSPGRKDVHDLTILLKTSGAPTPKTKAKEVTIAKSAGYKLTVKLPPKPDPVPLLVAECPQKRVVSRIVGNKRRTMVRRLQPQITPEAIAEPMNQGLFYTAPKTELQIQADRDEIRLIENRNRRIQLSDDIEEHVRD